MGPIVSIVRPDIVSHHQPQFNAVTIPTGSGSYVRKVDVRVRMCFLEFSYKMLVAEIDDETILGTDIVIAYGFVVGFRKIAMSFLRLK